MGADAPGRILLRGGFWVTNIGNAFINIGAQAILEGAFPGTQMNLTSGMPRWLFREGLRLPVGRTARLLKRLGLKRLQPVPTLEDNALDLSALAECDLLVLCGMMMCRDFVERSGKAVLAARRAGVPVLLLGTGAAKYDEDEKRVFSQYLRELEPIGCISRDVESFAMFGGEVAEAYEGIDCAFFVNEGFRPFPMHLPEYVVSAFDTNPEPPLDTSGRELVHAHHAIWKGVNRSQAKAPRTLMSDLPQDYLTLYAGAAEVHSDRVHACVAALAYGGRARLYTTTLRAALFDSVGAGAIRERLAQLDPALIQLKKQAQIEAVRRIWTSYAKRA